VAQGKKWEYGQSVTNAQAVTKCGAFIRNGENELYQGHTVTVMRNCMQCGEGEGFLVVDMLGNGSEKCVGHVVTKKIGEWCGERGERVA